MNKLIQNNKCISLLVNKTNNQYLVLSFHIKYSFLKKVLSLTMKNTQSPDNNQQNQYFNEALFKIDQMKTFYIQDWRKQKYSEDHIELEIHKQQEQQYDNDQKQEENKKISVKGLHNSNKIGSLPNLPRVSSISLPFNNAERISIQSNRSPRYIQSIPSSNSALKKRMEIIQHQNEIKKNKQIEKNIIRRLTQDQKHVINSQKILNLKKNMQLHISKKSIQDQFDKINLKTKKIYNLYNQAVQLDENQSHKHLKNKQINPSTNEEMKKLLPNLITSLPSTSAKIQQILSKYEHNRGRLGQDKSIQIKDRSQSKLKHTQVKQKQFKLHLKRQTINKILKKYQSNYESEYQKLFALKQKEKRKRKDIVRSLSIRNKGAKQIDSSSIHNFLELKNSNHLKHVKNKSSDKKQKKQNR